MKSSTAVGLFQKYRVFFLAVPKSKVPCWLSHLFHFGSENHEEQLKKNTRLYNPNPKLLRPAELDCLLGALFKGGGEPDFISSSQVSATLYTCDYNQDYAVYSIMIISLFMIPFHHYHYDLLRPSLNFSPPTCRPW